MIGKVLAGHFKITQALSSGGFGQTFLAEDTHIPGNPICVVKQLKPLNTLPQALALAQRLFEQEARTLTQLGKECNQIPNLQAYFTEDNEFYLVQEYIEGHTLDVELPPGTQWTEAKVLELLQGVLPILKFVHSEGVIHRDIKPANLIRRDWDGKLVLIDFGAIKAVQEQVNAEIDPTVATGTRIGTQGYAPTEQARGKPRPNSDLYALGMVGIQALTGRSPSQLDEDSQTGEMVWEHLSSASPGLKAVLSQMTRYHFKDRYQSVEEALQAVQRLAQPAATVAATDFTPTPMPTEVVTQEPPSPISISTEVIPPRPPEPIAVVSPADSRLKSQENSERKIPWALVGAAAALMALGAYTISSSPILPLGGVSISPSTPSPNISADPLTALFVGTWEISFDSAATLYLVIEKDVSQHHLTLREGTEAQGRFWQGTFKPTSTSQNILEGKVEAAAISTATVTKDIPIKLEVSRDGKQLTYTVVGSVGRPQVYSRSSEQVDKKVKEMLKT